MSDEKNRREAARWLQTARGDLETARILSENRRWAHACFHAQQAGEKALKALWYALDGDPWGHSILQLINELSGVDAAAHQALKDQAEPGARLDRFYVPTRYPNGLPDITPEAAFFERDASEAMGLAQALVDRIARLLP